MSALTAPTAEQRAALARDFNRRHPQFTLRSPRSQAHPTASESEWRAAPRVQAIRKPPPATRWQRFDAALWRLHDGMPGLWALLTVIVLAGSGTLATAMIACLLGWRP